MDIARYQPLYGSPGEALWAEGESSYVLAGRGQHEAVTRPAADLVGWCALSDTGAPIGIQVCRIAPDIDPGIAHGLLSWVQPQYRRHGVFAAIQAQVDADLLAQGITAIRSWVVEGPAEDAMIAAILARGGQQVRAEMRTIRGAPVRYTEFLRPLVAA